MTASSRRYIVSGRVQGVFFRASTQREAIDLGLAGWVRNRLDGSVEVLACGPAAALESFEKWLEIGPDYAKVTNIQRINEDPEAMPVAFEIRPTA